jgi:hypothetical protein
LTNPDEWLIRQCFGGSASVEIWFASFGIITGFGANQVPRSVTLARASALLIRQFAVAPAPFFPHPERK